MGDGGARPRARRGRQRPRHSRQDRGARRRRAGDRPPERAPRYRGLLRDRARRGERQPRPLRRRPLRPPRRHRRPHLPVRADSPRRLRRRGQAPHHDRHLRALVRLLRGLLRHSAEGAHEDRPGLLGGLREGRLRRESHLRHGGVQARRAHRGSARDVPVRLLHGAHAAGRDPSDLDSRAASPTACRWASRSRARHSARPRILDAAHALEQSIGVRRVCLWDELRARHRHRDPRAAAHADEDVLRLRALVRRGAEHAHVPGLPRPPRNAAGHERRGRPLRADDRDGVRLRDRPALDLPPQELLLSGPAEGLPDQPVRHSARAGTVGSATCASTACTWRRTRPS